MDIIIAIDGDLLGTGDFDQGMPGQRAAIARIADQLAPLIKRGHNLIVTHGNAPQVGFMLLRGEVARHVVHNLPLDICGADTQGATGYMLQQTLHNCLSDLEVGKEITTVITQVIIGEPPPIEAPRTKGIGPYFDWERAKSYKDNRGWDLAMVSGQGYQRVVPCLIPKRIVEANLIRELSERGLVVICGGGGGIPVQEKKDGGLTGVEAVVDKAYTAVLLAREVKAGTIVFVSPKERIMTTFNIGLLNCLHEMDLNSLAEIIENGKEIEDTMRHKLIASREFLSDGGDCVLIVPMDQLAGVPDRSCGVIITREKRVEKVGE